MNRSAERAPANGYVVQAGLRWITLPQEVWLCPATPSVERHLHPIANRVVLRADVAYDATEVVACGARGRPRS